MLKPSRWIVARHQEVAFVLKDRRFGQGPRAEGWRNSPAYDMGRPLFERFEKWMLFRDPPDHTRLRGLVSKEFTPAIIERMRPDIQSMADRLLDAAVGRERMELIADFAFPLPVMVMAGMLGVPAEDQHLFKGWSADIAAALGIWNPGVLERGARSAVACGQYLEGIVEERRRAPFFGGPLSAVAPPGSSAMARGCWWMAIRAGWCWSVNIPLCNLSH